MPNTHSTLTSLFTDIANAIRAKDGSSGTIVADNFPTAISNIPSGGGSNPSLYAGTFNLTDTSLVYDQRANGSFLNRIVLTCNGKNLTRPIGGLVNLLQDELSITLNLIPAFSPFADEGYFPVTGAVYAANGVNLTPVVNIPIGNLYYPGYYVYDWSLYTASSLLHTTYTNPWTPGGDVYKLYSSNS